MSTKNDWSVYIVRCKDSTLYTGISNNVPKRVAAHNNGRGAKYIIPARRPVELMYVEEGYAIGSALKRELAIKTSGKAAKEKLAASGFVAKKKIKKKRAKK